MPGYKQWQTNDVLLAAEVNDYLMDQVVMVFTDASTRSTALPTPEEGMVTYLESDKRLHVWNNSAWITHAYVSEVEESRNAQILMHMDVA